MQSKRASRERPIGPGLGEEDVCCRGSGEVGNDVWPIRWRLGCWCTCEGCGCGVWARGCSGGVCERWCEGEECIDEPALP